MFLRPFESGSGPVIICTNLDPALDPDPSINKQTLISACSDFFASHCHKEQDPDPDFNPYP